MTGHRRGEPGFRRASVALFAAGVSTFVLLYATQPLLPLFARDFRVSPADSSLTLAVATGALALALLPAGWLSDRWGRIPVISLALFSAASLGFLAALAPSFPALLALRAVQGVALAGVPAVAMAYLSEEIHPLSLGSSIGLYIGGNALGGMAGRLIAGFLAGGGDWRLAQLGISTVSLICAVAFVRSAPPSQQQVRTQFGPRTAWASLTVHLRDRGQLRLELLGALLMGTFVVAFNAIGFRLEAPPYGLGQATIGAIFLLYPVGSLSSAVAGRLADRIGRRRVLPVGVMIAAAGIGVTTLHPLPLVIAGIALLTVGFFASHSVASSWVGRRAPFGKAQASALYLVAYYAGSTLAGPLGGLAWSDGGWSGVATLASGLLAVAFLLSVRLRRTPPLVPLIAT